MRALTVDQALQQAVKAQKAGKVQEAYRLYTAILKAQPKHPDANHNMGLLAVGVGKVQVALSFFKTALEANPKTAQFWLSYIDALIELERFVDARIVLDQAKSKGAGGDGFEQLATRLNELEHEPAKASQKNSEPSQDQFQSLINFFKQGRLQQAQEQAETLVQQFPKSSVLHNLQGAILKGMGQFDQAIASFKKALTIKPDYAEAAYNLGTTLYGQGKLEEAIQGYRKAIAIKPDYAKAYYNMGNALREQGKLEETIEAYNKSLAIEPDNARIYNNMGNVLRFQGKLQEAIEAYTKALTIDPDSGEAYNNIGTALQKQGKFKEAIEAYKKSFTIKPDNAEAHFNIGSTLREQGKLEEAIEAYNNALAINPYYEVVRAQKLFLQATICDWDSMADGIKLLPGLGTTTEHIPPFWFLSLEDEPERHRIRSEIYSKSTFLHKPMSTWARPLPKQKKMKLGYFSADFHNHATMYLMAQIFAAHDAENFEVYAYSYGPDRHDEMRQKIVSDVDRFYDVRDMNDEQIVKLARANHLDIAIDLKGYTKDSRLAPFASRLAPVQISYLGYPGTLGAHFIDYIVADPILIPEDKRQYYTEEIIYLPHTYQPTDNKRRISSKVVKREDFGLPSNSFVFCCFNQNYKISPREFDIWMRLLGSVENSVLWLFRSTKLAEKNMKRQAEARGISSERIIFAERLPQPVHLARHRLANLFLDTFNYNAHTTTSDALWAGLPVVTKLGKGFAARVAGSLLNAIGLPELITETEQEYESLILELATHPAKLTKLQDKLDNARLTQPLFNTELYTKHLESGYQQAYYNYLDGNTPRTIHVQR